MFAKFSAECLHPLCKLTAGTYQLQNTFLGIQLSCVGGETVFTLLLKAAWLRETRKTQVDGRKKWQTNQLDEKTVSTSIVPFETSSAVDAIAKDRARV